MRRFNFLFLCVTSVILAQPSPSEGPYKVLKTNKVGGDGGFDYVYADVDGRRLYAPRSGPNARISVYDLDTLAPVGEVAKASARGAAVDPKTHHGFGSSKPVVMFDTKTLATIKTIDVQGNPDGIMFDPFNQRVWIFSHSAPNATVIDAKDGSIVGTLDLGGAPEQAVTDGKGHIWVDIEDKDNVAAIDAKAMTVTAHYDLGGKGGGPGGLALDVKNHLLFASCHNPATMVILDAGTGKIVAVLPIGSGTDGAGFNPNTMEAFSSNSNGTLTVIKEMGPASFEVEQNLPTMPRAKTMTIDTKTNRVLLIAAQYGPVPAPATPRAPGSRGPRPPMLPDSFTLIAVGK